MGSISSKQYLKDKSFTLVEIMIVVGIILLLAGIAIPNLARARAQAQENLATGALRTIVSVETAYRATSSRYANLAELYAAYPPYIDSALGSGNKQGYTFVVDGISSSQFYATAAPHSLTQGHTFYIDEDGVLCRSNTTNTVAPSSHVSSGCHSSFSEME